MSDAPLFVKGRDLCSGFYRDVIAPLVDNQSYAAALIGEGSEVLGLDTERSTDHAWGPRLQLFFQPENIEQALSIISKRLPATFRGWPTHFYRWQTGKVEHHIEVTTFDAWLKSHFGFDPRPGMTLERWLTVPQQVLLEFTNGLVFRDDFGELTSLRDSLSWYPRDVWLWLLASQWKLIADREHLVGRVAELEDELGARIITAELIRDIIRLWFLQERRYAPYSKWLGTMFTKISDEGLQRTLNIALLATDQASREIALCKASECVAHRHNGLKLTKFVEPKTGPFDIRIGDAIRPYLVLNAQRFVKACHETIENVALKKLSPVGSIDQLTHASDLLTKFTSWPSHLASVYRSLVDGVANESPAL